MRILVTDGDTRAALAITRSLGRSGHTVTVIAPAPFCLAGASRYCNGVLRQAVSDAPPAELANALQEAILFSEPQRVIGVTDRSLAILHRLIGIERSGMLPPPDSARYREASDKVRLYQSAIEQGIPVPEALVVEHADAPCDGASLARLGPPWAVRPALSWRIGDDRWIAGPVTIESTRPALQARISTDPALRHPFLIQRVVEGEGCGLFLYAWHGRIVQMFAHRRLREKPPSGGVSTVCESVAPPEDLVEYAARYVRATSWSGVAMLEFKRERRSGVPYLLEINARPWGSLHLALAAGLDFPALMLADGRQHVARTYPERLALRWWWGDLDHFMLCERRSGRGRAASLIRGTARCITSGPYRACWDTLRADDPLPFAADAVSWLS